MYDLERSIGHCEQFIDIREKQGILGLVNMEKSGKKLTFSAESTLATISMRMKVSRLSQELFQNDNSTWACSVYHPLTELIREVNQSVYKNVVPARRVTLPLTKGDPARHSFA